MNWEIRARQVWTITQLQLSRVFFSRRSFWVYLLALFPAMMFALFGMEVTWQRSDWADRIVSPVVLQSMREGESDESVLSRASTPVADSSFSRREDDDAEEIVYRNLNYFDGKRRWYLQFEDGVLQDIDSDALVDFNQSRTIFAAVFHHFYLRLAIFFGCLGIFMNLFRGEMLDKTLHYWFLVPARREVLLIGKYLAGLIAATVIFAAGALLAYAMMLWPQDPAELQSFWQDHGASHALAYAASAALGCVGYGSVFLAAGLLLRNPIVPAIVILAWEAVNPILPAALQKLSVLYYVQSLAPVPVPMDNGAPLLIRLLGSPAEPPTAAVAILGMFGLTAVVLWCASRIVNRLEIDYGTD
jgi:ABC-type transport system involved in multi-copper enzyme maturation permease subunit